VPYANVNGIKFNYNIEGSGEPIVLITGFGADLNFWKTTVPRLSDEFMVITVDNRGSGSTLYSGTFSIDDMADDIVFLLDNLSIKKAHILGWSMGSTIAQKIAINHPEKVKTLTVVSTYRYRPARAAYVLSAMVRAMEHGISKDYLGYVINGMSFTEEFFKTKEETAGDIKLPKISDATGLRAQLRAIDLSDTTDTTKRINAPTLLIHGVEDIMVEAEEGDAVADQIKDCKRFWIQNVGHSISSSLYIEEFKKHVRIHSN